jgi:hypothetical protein
MSVPKVILGLLVSSIRQSSLDSPSFVFVFNFSSNPFILTDNPRGSVLWGSLFLLGIIIYLDAELND